MSLRKLDDPNPSNYRECSVYGRLPMELALEGKLKPKQGTLEEELEAEDLLWLGARVVTRD